jgi:hypothetical protein
MTNQLSQIDRSETKNITKIRNKYRNNSTIFLSLVASKEGMHKPIIGFPQRIDLIATSHVK